MTYLQALDWWFGRVNYEKRTPRPGDLQLETMRTLLRRLGQPQERLRIVHVAGSKGKGSTSAMLASILRRAGYRTGLFTSPHLVQVEERMQVDGTPIAPQELAHLMGEVRDVMGELEPTFFEVATAAGFLHFVRRRVEVAVIEVGLGGRLDSTNVCQPLLAVITSINYDHTKQLGNTLASIAREKAGIIKPHRPVVSGVTEPEAGEQIIAIARERQAPLRQLGVNFHCHYVPGQVSPVVTAPGLLPSEQSAVEIKTEQRTWPVMPLGLLGEHQAANAAVAVACVEHLRNAGLVISDKAVGHGLAHVTWPARLEVLRRRPLVLLDCAHNVASAQALVDTLRTSFAAFMRPGVRRLLVFAGSSDKDLPGMLRILGPAFTHAYLTRYANSPRSVSPAQLVEIMRRVTDVPFTPIATAPDGWQRAWCEAGPDDLICVTGSVFLAGELRGLVSLWSESAA